MKSISSTVAPAMGPCKGAIIYKHVIICKTHNVTAAVAPCNATTIPKNQYTCRDIILETHGVVAVTFLPCHHTNLPVFINLSVRYHT